MGNPFRHWGEQTFALNETYWQHQLAVDYFPVVYTLARPDDLYDALAQIGRPILEDLIRFLQELVPYSEEELDDEPLEAIEENPQSAELIEQFRDDLAIMWLTASELALPYLRTLLLMRALLQGVRRDVVRSVLDMFEVELPTGEDALGYSESDRLFAGCLTLLGQNPDALRYIRWLEPLKTLTYTEFTLEETSYDIGGFDTPIDPEAFLDSFAPETIEALIAQMDEAMDDDDELDEYDEEAAVALEEIALDEVTVETVNKALLRGMSFGRRRRCLDVLYWPDTGRLLIFILHEGRRRSIREFQSVYFGTESELVILEFFDDLRKGRYIGNSEMARLCATAIAEHLTHRPMACYERLAPTPLGAIEAFFRDLEADRIDGMRLLEVHLRALELPGEPRVVIREGASGEHVGKALEALRAQGADAWATLAYVQKVRLLYRPHDIGIRGSHIFELSLEGNGLDGKLTLRYASRSAPRSRRERFAQDLMELYGVRAVSSAS